MAEWCLYGTDRKESFEKELQPNELAYTLLRYQKKSGKNFEITDLLELEKIKALALVAKAINDEPELLPYNIGGTVKEGIFNSLPESLESIADAIRE